MVKEDVYKRQLCKKGAVAFLMPPFAKSDLFKGVVMGGVLPRKTFSMGHAEEKRYYIAVSYTHLGAPAVEDPASMKPVE